MAIRIMILMKTKTGLLSSENPNMFSYANHQLHDTKISLF